jgi:hypothetical protein
MKTKVYLVALFLFFTAHYTFAQLYYPGYIIKNGNKTDGLIAFKKDKNDQNLLFKPTKSESPQEIGLEQITELYLTEFNARFSPKKNPATGKLILAELLTEGTVNLYNRDKLYILSKDTAVLNLTLPIGKAENITDSRAKKSLEIKALGTVKNFLSNCNNLKIKSVNSSSLKKAVKEYNECTNQSTPATKKKGGVGLGIVAGLNMSNLKFKSSKNKFLSLMDFDPSISFVTGLNVSFNPKKFLSYTKANIQLVYNQQKYSGKGSIRNENASLTEHYTTEITTSSLRLPVSIRRYFSLGNEGVFVDLGISPYLVLGLESTTDYKTKNDDNSPGISDSLGDILKKDNTSFAFFGNVGYARRINKLKYTGLIKVEFDQGFAHFGPETQKIFNTSLNLVVEF